MSLSHSLYEWPAGARSRSDQNAALANSLATGMHPRRCVLHGRVDVVSCRVDPEETQDVRRRRRRRGRPTTHHRWWWWLRRCCQRRAFMLPPKYLTSLILTSRCQCPTCVPPTSVESRLCLLLSSLLPNVSPCNTASYILWGINLVLYIYSANEKFKVHNNNV